MDIIKAIFTKKSLGLGWAVFWRSFVAGLVNGIAMAIVSWIASLLGSAVASIVGIVLLVYAILSGFMILGWAVQRIKDKL